MNAAWFFVPFEFYPIDREGRSIEPISPPNFFPPPTAWNDLFFETFYAPAIRLSSNASIGKKISNRWYSLVSNYSNYRFARMFDIVSSNLNGPYKKNSRNSKAWWNEFRVSRELTLENNISDWFISSVANFQRLINYATLEQNSRRV